MTEEHGREIECCAPRLRGRAHQRTAWKRVLRSHAAAGAQHFLPPMSLQTRRTGELYVDGHGIWNRMSHFWCAPGVDSVPEAQGLILRAGALGPKLVNNSLWSGGGNASPLPFTRFSCTRFPDLARAFPSPLDWARKHLPGRAGKTLELQNECTRTMRQMCCRFGRVGA